MSFLLKEVIFRFYFNWFVLDVSLQEENLTNKSFRGVKHLTDMFEDMPLPSPSPILIDIDSLIFFCCKFGRSSYNVETLKKRPAKKTSILNVQNSKHLDPIS